MKLIKDRGLYKVYIHQDKSEVGGTDSLGICGTPLAWLTSYIIDRAQTGFQSVQISNGNTHLCCFSGVCSWSAVVCAIYHGHEIYYKTHDLENHCYADDTQLHFSCKPEDVDTLMNEFIACTDELSAWMKSNRLKLNCDKSTNRSVI